MLIKICVLSAPPEIEVEDKFFNKACCYIPDLGICDFIHLPVKGLSVMTAYPCDISFVSSSKKILIRVDSVQSDKGEPVTIKVGK